jgi:hypothetical protein
VSRPSRRLATVAVAAAAAVSVAGLGAAPAQSATDSLCPPAFPVGSLVRDQPVTGLTVSQGTTPEGFTGKVIGVLDDGIMPGLDMILVRLTSPEVDKVGIWEGMSGSPVYAADGRLIGAVSSGLASGPSPVAGVTPAADMLAMLASGSPPAAPSRVGQVTLPTRLADRIVRSGDATPAQLESGMRQLELPFAVAGLGSQQRLRTVARLLDLQGMRLIRAGTTASTGAAASVLVPGGNLAAAIAYGDITAAGVGTTTAVCGDQVLGFGHPMLWTGPSSLSLHGADALFVQEDPTFTGFKVTNIGAPVGTITSDRMAGIVGRPGVLPPTSDVTSTVTSGNRSRTGATHITAPTMVPDIAVSHLLANEDRIFDGIGKGSAAMSWTIQGTRENGDSFTLRRADVYADASDITFATTFDLYDALSRLEFNGVEDVSLGSVAATATLTRTFDRYLMKSVEMRRAGGWAEVDANSELTLRAGTTKRFRVQLVSPVSGPRRLVLEVPVPRRAAGLSGMLSIFGGNTGGFSEEEFFGGDGGESAGGTEPQSVDEILASLRREPANDDVVANLDLFQEEGTGVVKRHRRTATGLPVDGAHEHSVTDR